MPPATTHCFTYGSLMCEDIMGAVCAAAPLTPLPARLAGYRRTPVLGAEYPGMVPAAGGLVDIDGGDAAGVVGPRQAVEGAARQQRVEHRAVLGQGADELGGTAAKGDDQRRGGEARVVRAEGQREALDAMAGAPQFGADRVGGFAEGGAFIGAHQCHQRRPGRGGQTGEGQQDQQEAADRASHEGATTTPG